MWIAIFGFVGNYLWTHYFYRLLGAAYTIRTYRLNDVRRAAGSNRAHAALPEGHRGHLCLRQRSLHPLSP